MKFELTPEEQQELQETVDNNNVRAWLKSKENLKFEIGDVLIKLIKQTDWSSKQETWKVENINSDNKMAQRYVYIFEDDTGIGYLKQLKVSSGTLGKEIYCLTNFDYERTKFQVDPEYAERLFLDAEFDIKDLHKKSLEGRKIVTKLNRKLGMKPKGLKDINDFFEGLKSGDTYWTSEDYTGRYTRECVYGGKRAKTVASMNREDDWHWRRFKQKHTIDVTEVALISYQDVDYKSDYNEFAHNIFDRIFYKTKPAKEEKK